MRAERLLPALPLLAVVAAAATASAQTSRQLSILQAEQRRAHTSRDLALLRSGASSSDADTAVLAVRALGRLERPALVPDILLALRSRLPEVRAEAADAVGQAAQGWGSDAPAAPLDRAVAALIARLETDDEADVRAAASETLGRLPYTSASQVGRVEAALVALAAGEASITDQLGVAKGLEALVRLHAALKPPEGETIALLAGFAVPPAAVDTAPRIRRLALTALISARAIDDELVVRAAADPDDQVRRLAMRASAADGVSDGTAMPVLAKGQLDPEPMVRIEAIAAANIRRRGHPAVCARDIDAAADPDRRVALAAIDQLEACGASPGAASLLERTAVALESPWSAGWHEPVHALVALAAAAPDRARALLPMFAASPDRHVRLYAARAAGRLHDEATLRRLAADADANVCEAAIDQLRLTSGHAADELFAAALSRPDYQVVRAAAYALTGAVDRDRAVAALEAALGRLDEEGADNSTSAREAIRTALVSLDAVPAKPADPDGPEAVLTLADWQRLVSARARITMEDGGAFELALLADQAPQAVAHFAGLARSGYYDGLTFHRVVPNFVVQGGSPGANEYVGDRRFMNDEVGRWPHTRGAVGLSTRGRDTGDAQFFIDLVDNPRLDHEYTVFAHVLDGMNVVDAIAEGDRIARVEILEMP